MTPHIDEITEIAIDVAKKAGKLLLKGFGGHYAISHKEGIHNLVTEYDKKSEAYIISTLKKRFPTHSFLGEEKGYYQDKHSKFLWVIDPLDGTVNFAHRIPFFSVSIACLHEGKPICGVVYGPILKELFTASIGKGSYLNEKRLQVSKTKLLPEAILVTGFPYHARKNPSKCIETFDYFVKMGLPIRRLGSAALDTCYVADGRFDGFWEVSLEPWDIAAVSLILEEAGGKMSHYDGKKHHILEGGTALCSNGKIHKQLIGAIYDSTH